MLEKSYFLLLDVADAERERIIRALRDNEGVVSAQSLEGSADIFLAMEASEKRQLTDLTYQAIASLDPIVDRVHLLPVQGY